MANIRINSDPLIHVLDETTQSNPERQLKPNMDLFFL
ncbi:Uncharacterised protein [Legionella pneumophila]|nr:Uncharacterised protein [Legionella pneumophila]CZH73381.1 Uncharacterised protein [Legionella pneumophila]CZI06851.1 Uncharacterised protein [Legionella pneumophila]CZI49897.1 Uncharacterised protein [Legionella pneumophila]CZL99584.1 Uncharacterised protein [Legionella pneumophila]